jgi:hypothetical protein
MATTYNSPKGIKFIPPPIPLRVPETKVLRHGDYMNVQLRANPNDADSSKYKMDIPFFKDGTPEEYVQWTTHLESVIQGLNITTGPNRYTICTDKLFKERPFKILIAMQRRAATKRLQT